MLQALANIFKVPDLRKRVLFTLGLFAVYRIGAYIPTPGIDSSALAQFFDKIAQRQGGTLFGIMNMFSGGAMRRLTVFALGIMPYISASIILQLLTTVVPYLERLSKEGEMGRKKIFRFGKHVGGKGLKAVLDSMKISVTDEQFKKIFGEIKSMGDKGKTITDADLSAIVKQVKGEKARKFLEVVELKSESGNKITPNAMVVVKVDGKEVTETAEGDGPVDAAINAIMKVVGSKNIKLEEYHVDAITGGTDAGVSVTVRMKSGDKVITASGVDTDIVMASVQAIVNGINLLS